MLGEAGDGALEGVAVQVGHAGEGQMVALVVGGRGGVGRDGCDLAGGDG